jgi:isopentenyldiphosphate isomerase
MITPTDREDEPMEVFDEDDRFVHLSTRGEVHDKGLIHREIAVWFITRGGGILFQHRAKDKDTGPNLFDATVGGHPDPGESYVVAAIREIKEETGLDLGEGDLRELGKTLFYITDRQTGAKNNHWKVSYGYRYDGRLEDLKVEEGKSQGFVTWNIDKILNLSGEETKLFVQTVPMLETQKVFENLRDLAN